MAYSTAARHMSIGNSGYGLSPNCVQRAGMSVRPAYCATDAPHLGEAHLVTGDAAPRRVSGSGEARAACALRRPSGMRPFLRPPCQCQSAHPNLPIPHTQVGKPARIVRIRPPLLLIIRRGLLDARPPSSSGSPSLHPQPVPGLCRDVALALHHEHRVATTSLASLYALL